MKSSKSNIIGRIHSIDSFGTLDGPGIRTVIFMANCPLRCKYCHNVDIVFCKKPNLFTPQQLLKQILKNKDYFELSGGGVTVSGGEPLLQIDFLKTFFKLCRKNKIHTTIDTSLHTSLEFLKQIEPLTDLFLVSLKHFDDNIHQKLTGVSNKQILKNIEYLSKKRKRLWLRLVILPSYTDTRKNLKELVKFCKKINFEQIELLPYSTMGVDKWKKLGLKYELEKIKPPTKKQIEKVKKILKKNSLPFLIGE